MVIEIVREGATTNPNPIKRRTVVEQEQLLS